MTRIMASGVGGLLGVAILLASAAPAAAHPLGNATVSRAIAVTVAASEIRVLSIIDMAEIPAFAALQAMDRDGDGGANAAERDAWASDACRANGQAIHVELDRRTLRVASASVPLLAFPPGAGGLETLRLECPFVAPAVLDGTDRHRLVVTSDADGSRPGWREVTIQSAPGVAIVEADVPATSPSVLLTSYPEDGLDAPLDVRGGSALVARSSAGAAGPLSSVPGAAPSMPGGPADDPLASALASAGGGGPLGIVLALLLAAGIGAAHALSPGHGKALVAASLVGSRGTMRQGLGLAVAVAMSHTAGVLVLGALVLGAGSVLAPDRVLAWLSLAAGACVVAVGIMLVGRATARLRDTQVGSREHAHAHPHAHPHVHAMRRPDGADHHSADPPDGLRTRGVLALGLFGGLVPSTSAVIVLLLAVTTGQLLLGLALILAFGAGMAAVLGGIAVACALVGRRVTDELAMRRPGLRRLAAAAVPLVSGLAVLVAGGFMALGALANVL